MGGERVRFMRERRSNAGRKSRGERELFATRLPLPLADQLRAQAEEQDLSLTDTLANLVAAAYGYPPVAEPKVSEQMRLTA